MKRLRSPLAQVLAALVGMFGGGALIDFAHKDALGFIALFVFLVLLVDGLFRQPKVPNDARELTSHQEVLRRAWRER